MNGDFCKPRDSGPPLPASPTLDSDSHEAAFWADSKLTARARHAARSRHPASWYARTERPARAADDPVPDPIEEFARAMDDYRRASGRMFPTWCEVLEVLRSLGYTRLGSPAVALAPLRDPLGFATKGETS